MARKAPDMYENKKSEQLSVEGNILKAPTKPKKQKENPHEKHRQRLRERFLREGLESFEEHNVLELLLFFSIPVKDTNKLAHTLINHFGSLSEVFDADYEELCKVNGIGERSAQLIKLMPELFKKYEMNKLNKKEVHLNSAELVAKYVSSHFKGLTQEELWLLCLDMNCKVLRFDKISEGTVNATMINNRKITECAILSNAASVILVHNHPSGITAPSKMDINATIDMADAMESVGIRLSDHIIIGHGDDYFSFRKSEKWKHIF
jgi:DNA repair protein RadC